MGHTPETVARFLDASMHRLDGPAQYLGDEPNAYLKDWARAAVRVLMVASWPYDQAAGNQSVPAVYRAVNEHDPYLCDRFYLPATPRDLRIFERESIPVFGIESKHPLADFDVVGTSISYVVLLMNFAKMLTMSGVPLRWRDRDGRHPMVMVGGQSYCAPEPMAPIADCVFLGEAEDEPGNGGVGQVCRMIEMMKAEGSWRGDREGCYRRLARTFDYLYFPRLVDVRYGHVSRPECGPELSRQVSGYEGLQEGMRMPFRKRHVTDLDAVAALDNPPLLFTDPSMGSGDLETSRGCPAWCSFCRLTFAQKPFRQHSVKYSTEHGRRLLDNTGGTELVPFGPDFPMQTNKNQLLASLLEHVTGRVDTVAQRVDDFIADETYLMLQAAGGATTITLGLEGASQRMRDLVGKATSEADVRAAVTRGIRAGFRRFKLFMIIGLPGEDTGDLAKIMDLARDLAAIREGLGAQGVRIQLSFTPLLIEAQTPFQWFSAWPIPNHDLIDVINACKGLGIEVKIGTKAARPRVMFFQLCQRASRDAGEAIANVLEAYGQGCWGGVPRDMEARLDEMLRQQGFANGLGDLLDERGEDDMFGWEFIDTGIERSLLWRTFRQMREFAELTDSATYDSGVDERNHGNEWIARCDEQCLGRSCGVCSRDDLELRREYLASAQRDRRVDVAAVRRVDQRTVAMRVRARLLIPERYRWADNGHWRHAVRRAAYRAHRQLGCEAQIARQSVVLASDGGAYRNWTCGADYVEFGLTRPLRGNDLFLFLKHMQAELITWADLQEWEAYPVRALMPARRAWSLFDLEVASPDKVAAGISDWNLAEHVPLRLQRVGSYFAVEDEEVNGKDHAAAWLVRDGSRPLLRMLLHHLAGPYQVWAALTGRPWAEAAAFPAVRAEVLAWPQASEACASCGQPLAVTLLGRPWHEELCPRCLDDQAGIVLAGTAHGRLGA